jgi:RNA polymerase sigma-70 factor (ECF subfamily)
MSALTRTGHFLEGFEKTLTAARLGEQSQLGVLLDVYRGYLLSIASDKLSQEVVAKAAPSDLVQETLLQASQAFGEFRGSTELELRAWLNQILARKVIDVHRYYRDFAKRDISREVSLSESFDGNEKNFGAAVVDASPSVSAGHSENAEILTDALSKLNEEQQRAVQLRSFEQLSFEEVGERMGRSADAARKLWTRAIQNLTLELQSQEPRSTSDGR